MAALSSGALSFPHIIYCNESMKERGVQVGVASPRGAPSPPFRALPSSLKLSGPLLGSGLPGRSPAALVNPAALSGELGLSRRSW